MKKTFLALLLAAFAFGAQSCSFTERDDEADVTSVEFVTLGPPVTFTERETEPQPVYNSEMLEPMFFESGYERLLYSNAEYKLTMAIHGINFGTDDELLGKYVADEYPFDEFRKKYDNNDYTYEIIHYSYNDEYKISSFALSYYTRSKDKMFRLYSDVNDGEVSFSGYDFYMDGKNYHKNAYDERPVAYPASEQLIDDTDPMKVYLDSELIEANKVRIDGMEYIRETRINAPYFGDVPFDIYFSDGLPAAVVVNYDDFHSREISYLLNFTVGLDQSVFVVPENVIYYDELGNEIN